MSAISSNNVLTVNSYFDNYAFDFCSDDLSTNEKVIALAVTFFASIATGGLFAVGILIYRCCCISNPTDTSLIDDADESLVDGAEKVEYTAHRIISDCHPPELGQLIDMELTKPVTISKVQIAIGRREGIVSRDKVEQIELYRQDYWSGHFSLTDEEGVRNCSYLFYKIDGLVKTFNFWPCGTSGKGHALKIETPVTEDKIKKAIAKAEGIEDKDAHRIVLKMNGTPLSKGIIPMLSDGSIIEYDIDSLRSSDSRKDEDNYTIDVTIEDKTIQIELPKTLTTKELEESLMEKTREKTLEATGIDPSCTPGYHAVTVTIVDERCRMAYIGLSDLFEEYGDDAIVYLQNAISITSTFTMITIDPR